jgi:tellurite methyltransferase
MSPCRPMNRSVDFFNTQFKRQISGGDFALNPFEKLALPFLRGRVLDLGCGLGNLSIEAARRGCSVLALDASVNAIERIREVVGAHGLPIEAKVADLAPYRIAEDFDVIVSIGLLMFMESICAHQLLKEIQSHVKPNGLAIINVLIEGTTYLDMFEPGHSYLFGENELRDRFAEWDFLESKYDSFDAPGSTVKRFATVVARKPPM